MFYRGQTGTNTTMYQPPVLAVNRNNEPDNEGQYCGQWPSVTLRVGEGGFTLPAITALHVSYKTSLLKFTLQLIPRYGGNISNLNSEKP